MNLKNLFILTLAFTACQPNAPSSNIQNAPPSPAATTPNAPVNINSENANLSNAANANIKTAIQTPKPSPSASASPKNAAPVNSSASKYKNYTVKGVVKGIDIANNSITIDHEDIGDYMVAMEMPFPVADKSLLKTVKVGDAVEFVLETGTGVERIIRIRKR